MAHGRGSNKFDHHEGCQKCAHTGQYARTHDCDATAITTTDTGTSIGKTKDKEESKDSEMMDTPSCSMKVATIKTMPITNEKEFSVLNESKDVPMEPSTVNTISSLHEDYSIDNVPPQVISDKAALTATERSYEYNDCASHKHQDEGQQYEHKGFAKQQLQNQEDFERHMMMANAVSMRLIESCLERRVMEGPFEQEDSFRIEDIVSNLVGASTMNSKNSA